MSKAVTTSQVLLHTPCTQSGKYINFSVVFYLPGMFLGGRERELFALSKNWFVLS